MSTSTDTDSSRPAGVGAPPVLLLTEGDANTWDSWSGCSRALLHAFRDRGVPIDTADVVPSGFADLASKLVTVAPGRRRWAARHHFGPVGFAARSSRARRRVVGHAPDGVVLQVGATFCAVDAPSERYYCYCDGNVLFSARGDVHAQVTALRPREFQAMVERERRVYSHASAIFTMSECVRRSFIEDFGIAAERVITVHAGANMRIVPSLEELPAPKGAEPTVAFVGKEFDRKGGRVLVAAWNRVRRELPTARLVIAGATPDLPDTAGIDVRGFVRADDPGRDGLSALYRGADLFCMPSLYEPFGVVFVEAMMHGLPCVGTTEWAMPEVIRDGETGFLVPPNDPDALARTLVDALRNRSRLVQMGLAARRHAERHFTWNQVVARMLEVFDRGRARD